MRGPRIMMGLVALASAGAVSAQSFNQEWQRYRFSRFECAQRHERRVETNCNERCRAAAAAGQTRCLAEADRRYERALGRVMRSRR